MSDYFIADLHLGPQQPHLTELCLHFLSNQALDAKRLFILGDFFEYWLGDDAIHPHYQPIIDSLHKLSIHGVEVFFMHGNRDFLVGERFSEQCGIRLLDDPCVLDISGQATLLSHGDLFCSDDLAYQEFRTMVRNPDWQTAFLSKPIEARMAYAEQARNSSRSANQQKSDEIMDVNQQTIIKAMQQYGVTRLIHGHTHRPAQHDFEVDGCAYQRIVLANWGDHGHYLKCSDHGCVAEKFS